VDELRTQAARFRERTDAAAFVSKVRASADAAPAPPTTASPRGRSARAASIARIGYVAGPLLAAALVLLVVRGRGQGDGAPAIPGTTPSLQATVGATATTATTAAESRFKGGLVVAVVRERAGHQERLTGPFQVRAGDRVRVEVSIDREGPVAAGLLTDEGEWVALLAPAALEAGTHFSELAARFDESPTRATLVVGEPEAVQRARATRDFVGVVAWRVTNEAAP
jgi:hypothetical protein